MEESKEALNLHVKVWVSMTREKDGVSMTREKDVRDTRIGGGRGRVWSHG